MPQNVTTSAAPARRPIPRELAKILADCRDITVHRLLLSFTALLDRVCDMLMDRAGKSDSSFSWKRGRCSSAIARR